MSGLLIISSVVARDGTYGETISDTQDFQVDGNPRELSRSDGGVLIEEISVQGLQTIESSNERHPYEAIVGP